MRFEVLKAVKIMTLIFRDMMLCTLVDEAHLLYEYFGKKALSKYARISHQYIITEVC
jgi:hypothetical protein